MKEFTVRLQKPAKDCFSLGEALDKVFGGVTEWEYSDPFLFIPSAKEFSVKSEKIQPGFQKFEEGEIKGEAFRDMSKMSVEEFGGILYYLKRWTYAMVKIGRMVRKSDQERMLMKRYGVDHVSAHEFCNMLHDNGPFMECDRDYCMWLMASPEPTIEEFSDNVEEFVK